MRNPPLSFLQYSRSLLLSREPLKPSSKQSDIPPRSAPPQSHSQPPPPPPRRPLSSASSARPLPLPERQRQSQQPQQHLDPAQSAPAAFAVPSTSTATSALDALARAAQQQQHTDHMDDLSLSSSASYANSWISWFLASKGNEYFCEVDEEYILDRFNLTGLNAEVQGYSAALDLITDTAADEDLNDEQREQLESSARHLYGLIHARFIITSRGLSKMIDKHKKGDFGRCPRVLCYGQPLLPLGLSDLPYQKAVKLYCPRCEDLYSPKSSRHGSIDGAYFGSTFAHMLFMVYPGMIPSKSVPGAGQGSGGQGLGGSGLGARSAEKVERVRPRIFGFQVHETARLLRWQEKVRDQQIARLEEHEREGAVEAP